MARLDEFMDLIEELRSHIDRSQFDLDALLDKLDYDAENLVDFVTNEIHFEQYSGLLRGAQGTLMSRAGNSLDQSVLLARLLKDAGYEARVVRGRLPLETANELFDQSAVSRPDVDLFLNASAARQIFTRLNVLVGIPEVEAEITLQELTGYGSDGATDLRAATRQEARSIQRKLASAGIDLGSNDALHEIRQEAQDYFWVQYRLDTSSWKRVHPAFGSGRPASKIETTEVYSEIIPAVLQHRLTLQVFLERAVGDSVETVALTDRWDRPAANLIEAPVVFSNTPVRPPGAVGSLEEIFTQSDVFVPSINGVAASDLAFDISGNTIPMMAVQAAASELFRTVSAKGDQATSALESLGAEPGAGEGSVRELRTLWVDLELLTPDGRTLSFRQDVWPRLGSKCGSFEPEPNCSKDERLFALRRALATQISLATATGTFPSAYVLDRVLERIVGSRALLELQLDPERASNMEEWARLEGVDTSWLGYLPLYDAFDHSGSAARIYRSRPSLMAFRQAIDDQGELRVSLDVMANAKTAVTSTEGGATLAKSEIVTEGVWETVVENLFLAGSREEALNRALPIARSGDNFEEIEVIQEISQLADLELADESKGAIARDLERGYAVILPRAGELASLQQVAWYRVDPISGETLGVTIDGRGGALEYLGKLLVGIFIVAPIYVAGCLLAGGELSFCVMAVGKTAASIGLGAVAVGLSVFGAITFTPSEAY